ncbi:MAG: SDR family oxidoreductase [Nitrospiria bacterium]
MRTVIITGASSGIGLETTKRLLNRGDHVIGIARDCRKASLNSSNFIPVPLDLSDLPALPDTFSKINRNYPEISGIIACAGKGNFGNIEEFSYAQISDLMNLNFTSHCFLVRAFMPHFKQLDRSDIILIGSEAALTGGAKGAVYSASKFALRGFAQSLRKECAKSTVKITLINPGMVKTPFFNTLSFAPGTEAENYIEAADVAEVILSVLDLRPGTVMDEINLSPLKKVIRKNK